MITYAAVLLLCVASQAEYWLMTTPLQGSQRRCILADAYGFGTCYERAKQMRIDAGKHQTDEMFHLVWMYNGMDRAFQWKQEAEWRRLCWDALEDALNVRVHPTRRLEQLERLYDLLGDEMYLGRAMPSHTPQYRIRR